MVVMPNLGIVLPLDDWLVQEIGYRLGFSDRPISHGSSLPMRACRRGSGDWRKRRAVEGYRSARLRPIE
jgi:hypothetical protein